MLSRYDATGSSVYEKRLFDRRYFYFYLILLIQIITGFIVSWCLIFKDTGISGILQKHGPLDREEEPFVVLNVSATDNGVPSMTSYVEVNVTVLDFNDNAPFFVNFTNETHIQENATLDSFVYKVTALDDDTGPNANVTYSFEDNTDKNFEINALDVSSRLIISSLKK